MCRWERQGIVREDGIGNNNSWKSLWIRTDGLRKRAEAIHIGYIMLACDGKSAGGLFHWKLDTCDGRAYSLDTADYSRLPLFTRQGPCGSKAFLNLVFWLST